MNKQEFLTKSAEETQKVAAEIVKGLLEKPHSKAGVVLALEGELGAGKTTFVQGLAKALGVKEKITSPTFVILKHFGIMNHELGIMNFYHIDCYRLDSPKELQMLGFDKILKDPKNLIVIEWADKVKSLIPQDAVWVGFEWVGEEERKIIIKKCEHV